MKRGFLKRLLLFVLITVLVNAVLISVAFIYMSRSIFFSIKAEELTPRAEYIANISAQYLGGVVSSNVFKRLLVSDRTLWDATVHVYDAQSTLIVRTEGTESEEALASLEPYVAQVLAGERVTTISGTHGLGIIVGVPIYGVDAEISGAVFLTKSLYEANAALDGFTAALVFSLLAVFVIMIPIAYFGSRGLSRPLKQMTGVAHAMAAGDFSIKADETRRDEIGQLGQTLNLLSSALSQTIGDLTLERNRLRSILDGVGEGIIAVDASGEIMHSNPIAAQLLGGTAGENLSELEAFRSIADDIGRVTNGRTPSVRDMQVGEAILRVTVTPLTAADDSFAGTITLVQDVTEAERLEQTRRDYVANVSHELRTPIASIRSLADALNDGLITREEDRSRYYGYILRESMRLSRLINDLLELSRLQSGTIAMQSAPFDLRTLLCDLAEQFSQTAAESGLSFRLECPDGSMRVVSNRDRVEQVLVILLDNAVKYAQDGGSITLCAEANSERTLLYVENTGKIDPSDLPHLFERFYKADKAHAQTGMGLGLSIAQEIMHLMGQRIWAENKDGCARFSFTLPSPLRDD